MRRVAPPRGYEKDLDRLTEPDPAGIVLFETKQKALMFAAALGRARGKRTELEGKGTAIRYDVFQKEMDDGFINALAVAEEKDLKALSEENEDVKVTAFEEYAHTGLIEIVEKCFNKTGDPLEVLVNLTDEMRATTPKDLDGLDPGILEKLISR